MGPEAQAGLQRLRASTAEYVAYGISLVPEVRSVCSCPAWGDHFLLVEGHFLVGGVLETLSCPSLCFAIPALSLVTLPLLQQVVPSVLAAIFPCSPGSKGE